MGMGGMVLAALITLMWLGRDSAEAQSNRLVLAFYYAWFDPSSFGPGKTPFSNPAPYYSSDAGTIQRQVTQAKGAGIDGFVQSWYGPDASQQTEPNFRTLLDTAAANGFYAAVDFEPVTFMNSNEDRIAALQTLLATHAQHPAYLRYNGKPVIFFWANWALSVDDWAYIRAAADPGYSSYWIAEGANTDYLSVFDGLHLYNTAWSADPASTAINWGATARANGALWVATAMPGWNDTLLPRADAFSRDREGGAYYQRSFNGAAASNPDMLIITSFNEWPEGSHIEPSNEFGNTYLDLTAQLSAAYKAGTTANVPPPPPQPTVTPGPSPTPTTPPTPVPLPTPLADGRIVYAVQPGDTMIGIASHFKLTLADLYAVSGLTPGSVLSIGQEIVIGYAEENESQLSADTSNLTSQRFNSAELTADGAYVHLVEAGDTPISIAIQYDLTLNELYEVSGLDKDALLSVGQKVLVGYQQGSEPPLQATRESAEPLIPPQFANAKVREDGKFIHIVVANDTPGSIAFQYDLTLDQFYAVSGLANGALLQLGQEVIVGDVPQPAFQGGSTDMPLAPTSTPVSTATPTALPTPIPSPTPIQPTLPPPPQAVAESIAAVATATPNPVLVQQSQPVARNNLIAAFLALFGSLIVLLGVGWYLFFGRNRA